MEVWLSRRPRRNRRMAGLTMPRRTAARPDRGNTIGHRTATSNPRIPRMGSRETPPPGDTRPPVSTGRKGCP